MEQAALQFKGFIINKSLFKLIKDNTVSDLTIEFNPSGELDRKNLKFNLNLGVVITDKYEKIRIEIESTGIFTFSNLDEDGLKNFLFLNAPAILFPYIRAYISTLTTLSGISPITLPTLNITKLRKGLEENIRETELS